MHLKLFLKYFFVYWIRDIDNRIAVADKLKQLEAQQTENIKPSSTCCPKWINESLFLNVVRADSENFHKILKFAVSPASISGDSCPATQWQIDIDIEQTGNFPSFTQN